MQATWANNLKSPIAPSADPPIRMNERRNCASLGRERRLAQEPGKETIDKNAPIG
jgi:hypothetical protein